MHDIMRKTGLCNDLSFLLSFIPFLNLFERFSGSPGMCSYLCYIFVIEEERRKNTANNYACGNCGATLRYRALAHAYIAHFASGRANNLRQALRKGVFDDTKILDFSLRGPTRNLLKKRRIL